MSDKLLKSYIRESIAEIATRHDTEVPTLGDLYDKFTGGLKSSISDKLIKFLSGGKAKLAGAEDPKKAAATFSDSLAEWFDDAKDIGMELTRAQKSEVSKFATSKYAEFVKKKVEPEAATRKVMALLDRKYGK